MDGQDSFELVEEQVVDVAWRGDAHGASERSGVSWRGVALGLEEGGRRRKEKSTAVFRNNKLTRQKCNPLSLERRDHYDQSKTDSKRYKSSKRAPQKPKSDASPSAYAVASASP
jgi:hypothetical protein